MSTFALQFLPDVKVTLREPSNSFDEEICSYIDACILDLENAGILPSYFQSAYLCDSLIKQAIRWYCLSAFGLYNTDSEKYMNSYLSLKSTLATQAKYTEG